VGWEREKGAEGRSAKHWSNLEEALRTETQRFTEGYRSERRFSGEK